MKKKSFIGLLSLLTITAIHADIATSNNVIASDRLELLTQTLSEGSYSHPDDLDLPKDITLGDKTIVESEKQKIQIVLKEDYKRNGISVLYPNSHVIYTPTNNEYSEINKFKNNILMVRNLSSGFVSFFDMDVENSTSKSWNVNCVVDRITDERICILSKFDFRLIKSSKSGLILSISSEPNKLNFRQNHYLRIDKNTPFKTNSVFTGTQVNNIISQMKSGSTAHTRFHEWTDTYEETLSLYGFSIAYETMNLMYQNLKVR